MTVAFEHAGPGERWDRDWMAAQSRDDPDGILTW